MTKRLRDIYFVTMTKYYKEYEGNVFIKPMDIKNTLSETLSHNELRQLHLAETEKFAHVTKFFNGDKQIVRDGEKDILVPSHKVATYDLDPEMSAQEIYDEFIVKANDFDFIVTNFANGDMVGHTGVKEAIIEAVKVIDKCVEKVVEAAKANDYETIIIADHGNADNAINADGSPNTAHSLNPVPLVYITNEENATVEPGILADVSPTLCQVLGIDVPKEMTGKGLITF